MKLGPDANDYGTSIYLALSYIFSYLSLIGTAEYSNHYYGNDFLYDIYTALRLERFVIRKIEDPITEDPRTEEDTSIEGSETADLGGQRTILVIGGGSQTKKASQHALVVGHEYASGHPVEALKFLQTLHPGLNSGRGGGVIDNRSDCSVFEGYFE